MLYIMCSFHVVYYVFFSCCILCVLFMLYMMCSFHVVYDVFFSCCILCVLFMLYMMCSFHVVYYVFFLCCTAFFNKISSKPRHYQVTVNQHLFLKLGEVISILCFLSLFSFYITVR